MTATIEFHEQRLEMFPTAVFQRRYRGMEGVHRVLRELILAREAEHPGVVRSNVGGWHSESDLLHWRSPAIEVLTALFQDAVHHYLAWQLARDPARLRAALRLEGWANVVRRGQYHTPHVHPGSHYALVYIVDAGDAPEPESPSRSGVVELLDPRCRPHMFPLPEHPQTDSLATRPADGLLMLFPAWVYHHVHPYTGERPRVSIACNVTVKEILASPAPDTAAEVEP